VYRVQPCDLDDLGFAELFSQRIERRVRDLSVAGRFLDIGQRYAFSFRK
jgi:hypothetical protein